jgi:succinate dehydrogenase/fumarate reductase cytochrome b subunit
MGTEFFSESKFRKFLPRHSKKSALWWVLQRITGVMLFFLILFHMLVNHYLSAHLPAEIVEIYGIASFQAVQWKMINFPLYFLISILFVITVVFHMLNGFRTVTLDLTPGKVSKRLLAIVLLLIGFLLVVYAFFLNSTVMVA